MVFKITVLNMFVFRIVGRLGDPLVGVHDWLLGGEGLVIPGCTGLSDAVQNMSKIVISPYTWFKPDFPKLNR